MKFDSELGWRPPPISAKSAAAGACPGRRTDVRGRTGFKRIVAIGDSSTFGMDVDDGGRFTVNIQRRLDHVEALNLTSRSRIVTAVLERAGLPILDTRKLFARHSPDPDRLLYAVNGVHWKAGPAIAAAGIMELMQAGMISR